MAHRTGSTQAGPGTSPPESQALALADRGVRSSGDFRNLMSALMTDTIKGTLSPEVTNAVCNAGGKLLKMVELEYKYASKPNARGTGLIVAGDELAQLTAG